MCVQLKLNQLTLTYRIHCINCTKMTLFKSLNTQARCSNVRKQSTQIWNDNILREIGM